MAIRINALPAENSPVPSEVLPLDGATTRKVTIQKIVDTGAPVASQAEAEAGVNNVKRMTPLTTAQALSAQIGVTIASQAAGELATSALQPTEVGTTIQPFSDRLQEITIASGTTGQVLALQPDDTLAFTNAGAGDMITAQYDPDAIGANAFDAGNQVDFVATAISSKSIPAPVMVFRTSGYSTPGTAPASFTRVSAPGVPKLWHRQDATGAWFEIADGEVSPEMLGAVGDGVADDIAALQAANDFGRPIRGRKEATYKINSIWTLSANCDINLNGARIDMSGISGTRHGIVIAGSLASTTGTALSADVAEKSYTANVGSGAVYSENEDVLLSSDDFYAYTGTNVSKGEIKRIRSIASDTLTFTTPANDNYTFGLGAGAGRVRRVNWIDGVKIRNLHVIGSGGATTAERGICLRYCRDFLIENVTVEGQQQYQIEINSCLRGRINNATCNGVYYDGVTGNIFYGISIMNCSTDITVTSAFGQRNRHLVVTTANQTGQGYYGEPCDISVIGCSQKDSQSGAGGRSFAYEVHGFGRNVLFIGCTADGCYSFIKIENGRGCQVSACSVRNYEFAAVIIGDQGQYNRDIKIDLTADGYTGGVVGATAAVVNFEGPTTNVYENIDIKVSARGTRNPGNTAGIGCYAPQGVYRQVKISGVIDAGVDDANAACVRSLSGADGLKFHDLTTIGYRTGIQADGNDISVRNCNLKRLSAAAGTGLGVLITGARARVKISDAENMFVGFRLTGTGGVASDNTARTCTSAFDLGTNVNRGNDIL